VLGTEFVSEFVELKLCLEEFRFDEVFLNTDSIELILKKVLFWRLQGRLVIKGTFRRFLSSDDDWRLITWRAAVRTLKGLDFDSSSATTNWTL
jgi:hypothetical protein